LAAEYSDPALRPVHRLSVDCYAVQHAGDGSRQAIQSVGLHLARLTLQLEGGLSAEAANQAMLRLADRKDTLPRLDPPHEFRFTVADVAPLAGGPRHAEAVELWARATLADWAHAEAAIRNWASGAR
jgi:hypothetical protein